MDLQLVPFSHPPIGLDIRTSDLARKVQVAAGSMAGKGCFSQVCGGRAVPINWLRAEERNVLQIPWQPAVSHHQSPNIWNEEIFRAFLLLICEPQLWKHLQLLRPPLRHVCCNIPTSSGALHMAESTYGGLSANRADFTQCPHYVFYLHLHNAHSTFPRAFMPTCCSRPQSRPTI